MSNTVHLYITDKTGKKFWRTTVTDEFSQGERNNLSRRLEQIKARNKAFAFVDADSARIVCEDKA